LLEEVNNLGKLQLGAIASSYIVERYAGVGDKLDPVD